MARDAARSGPAGDFGGLRRHAAWMLREQGRCALVGRAVASLRGAILELDAALDSLASEGQLDGEQRSALGAELVELDRWALMELAEKLNGPAESVLVEGDDSMLLDDCGGYVC